MFDSGPGLVYPRIILDYFRNSGAVLLLPLGWITTSDRRPPLSYVSLLLQPGGGKRERSEASQNSTITLDRQVVAFVQEERSLSEVN